MIGHLENYGINTEEKFKPNLCSDISITINENGGGNGEKDKEQDEEINKKANTADVNEALVKVTDVINKNVDNIFSLSGQVQSNTNSINDIKIVDIDQNHKLDDLSYKNTEQDGKILELSGNVYTNKDKIDALFEKHNEYDNKLNELANKNNEQDDKILELSGKVQSSFNLTGISSMESAITEALKADIYNKCESDERFVNKNDFNNFNNTIVDTLSAYTEVTDNRLNGLENKYGELDYVKNTTNENSRKINEIDNQKLDKNTFDSFKTDTEDKLSNLSNTVNNKAEKNDLDTLTATVNEKANKLYVDDERDKLLAKIEENKQAIGNTATNFNNKANIEDVNNLSAKVNDFDSYIHSIANNKVEKSDLNALSGKVTTLADTLTTKADKSDLNAVSASVASNITAIENLGNNKQDKGDYVLSSKLDDYYTKNETSGATDIENALNGKQDKGDYVLSSKLDDYYKKSEAVDLDTFNDYTGNVTTTLSTKANKDYVDQINNKVATLETGTTKVTNDLSALKNNVESNYATNTYVNNAVNGITTGITNNNELIAKISDTNNLALYDKTTGQFINNGNGVLDVLHRKFHLLIKGLDESDTNLDSYLSKLNAKIGTASDFSALETRVQTLETDLQGIDTLLTNIIGHN